MAKLRQLPRPVMRPRAGLHADQAGRKAREDWQHLCPPNLTADQDRPGGVDRVNREHVLGQIKPDRGNLLHEWLPSWVCVTAPNLAHCDAGSGSHPLHQGRSPGSIFRIRELLIRQRTQAINALRGHLTEFGQIMPQGAANSVRLIAIVEDPDSGFPPDVIANLKVLVAALSDLETEIGTLDAEIARRAKENDVARRLMTVPGIGPLIATAIAVLAPPPRDIPQGARLCSLARPDTPAAFHRGQAAPWRHDQDGRAIPPAASDHRGEQRHHQAAGPCRGPAGHLAGRHAGEEAADAGARGAGQQ
jgi:hypothetical protein